MLKSVESFGCNKIERILWCNKRCLRWQNCVHPNCNPTFTVPPSHQLLPCQQLYFLTPQSPPQKKLKQSSIWDNQSFKHIIFHSKKNHHEIVQSSFFARSNLLQGTTQRTKNTHVKSHSNPKIHHFGWATHQTNQTNISQPVFCLLQALIDANMTMTKTSKPKQMAAHPLTRMDTIHVQGDRRL